MQYAIKTLRKIYDRTTGYSHLCGKKLSWINYARPGRKGAWEVEHSNPKAKGGTDRVNNLFPAHITCNRAKTDYTTRTARGWHGRKRAPLSRERRKKAKRTNAVTGAVLGGLVGSILGPWGVAAGVAIGAKIGHSVNPDKG